MSIKSIPLKTLEVQAILDDRKSTMRRVVKPHNARKAKLCEYTQGSGLWVEDGYIKDYSVSSCWMKIEDYISKYYIYKPGDILWVRETFLPIRVIPTRYVYRCGFPEAEGLPVRWHPSIHMPREAARLFLRVKSVRVEQLQEITDAGAEAEGAKFFSSPSVAGKGRSYIQGFGDLLWNSTIKPADFPRYGWDANPFVWVVEFEQCERPEGFLKEDEDHER